MKKVNISTEYITLGRFLKFVDIIPSGAMAKFYLNENDVFVNGEKETRRGRKLYKNDEVVIKNEKYLIG